MKLTTTTRVSVDGVVQGNGGADAKRSGGFDRGGWARPLFDSQAMTFVDQVYQHADAFLFGRRTYELVVGYWACGKIWETCPRCFERAAQARRIEHAHRTAMGDREALRILLVARQEITQVSTARAAGCVPCCWPRMTPTPRRLAPPCPAGPLPR